MRSIHLFSMCVSYFSWIFTICWFQPLFGSTAFVMGPQKQLRMMFDPVRLYATAIYAGCVVLALIFALWVRTIWNTHFLIVKKMNRHMKIPHCHAFWIWFNCADSWQAANPDCNHMWDLRPVLVRFLSLQLMPVDL